MLALPESWTEIPETIGSYSRGKVHDGLVEGVEIRAEDFNGIHCIGSVGNDTFVVSEDAEGSPDILMLYVVRKEYPREPEVVHVAADAEALNSWLIESGGTGLPRKVLEEKGFAPSYAVHTYAVIRIKTIGESPAEGETIQQFAERVSDKVAASLNRIDVRGVSVPGCDVEQIEYAEEISSVLVDEILPNDDDPTGERTTMHWFDDRMEPNDGNGTDPARYARLEKLVTSIAETPLEGEPCDDAPGGIQRWDPTTMAERLEEIVKQCRQAIAKPQPKETL